MCDFKIGDIVECIKKSLGITIGKQYKIIEFSDDLYWIRINNDSGKLDGYSQDSFKLISRPQPKTLKDYLSNSVIHIYTGKPPKLNNNSYTFKTSSPDALDYGLIFKELTKENPLAIIHRSDGYHKALIHESIIQKLSTLTHEYYMNKFNKLSEWRKTEKGNIAEIIKLVKMIKNASWPNKKETTFKVDIIKI